MRALVLKCANLSWTDSGDKARASAFRHDAQYIMYIYLRDSYTTTGRDVFETFTITGEPVQLGLLSVADATTGRIIWFSTLQRKDGDLRTRKGMHEAISLLLRDMPVL